MAEWSGETLYGGGYKRRFWYEVWTQDPPPWPIRSGSGEAISVEKKKALLQSVSGKTRCMLARGNENAGLVLAFMRWWEFCSSHFFQIRWDFILEQLRLLFWSPKHIHCHSTEMFYNWMGLPTLRLAFLFCQVQWLIPDWSGFFSFSSVVMTQSHRKENMFLIALPPHIQPIQLYLSHIIHCISASHSVVALILISPTCNVTTSLLGTCL